MAVPFSHLVALSPSLPTTPDWKRECRIAQKRVCHRYSLRHRDKTRPTSDRSTGPEKLPRSRREERAVLCVPFLDPRTTVPAAVPEGFAQCAPASCRRGISPCRVQDSYGHELARSCAEPRLWADFEAGRPPRG